MRLVWWFLAAYLVLVVAACVLVHLGDAHGLAVGARADRNEHLLLAAVPLTALWVAFGGLAFDGARPLHLLVVVATALAQAGIVVAVVRVATTRRSSAPPDHAGAA